MWTRRRRRRAVVGGLTIVGTLVGYLAPSYAASGSCVADSLPASDQSPVPAAVDFDSSTDGWIVGAIVGPEADCEAESYPWAVHWDGSEWTDTSASLPHWNCRSGLTGVVAQSPTSAWAVGGDLDAVGMAFHWNGSQWSEAPPPAGTNFLGVDATAHSHVWAVADTGPAEAFRRAHGDWVAVKTPAAASSRLTSISVVSDSDVWAAGYTTSGRHAGETMVLHWNGTKWTLFHTPSAGSATSSFSSVAARSANDVWAAGYYAANNGERTLTAHWNGGSWSRIPSPNPGTATSDTLSGVAVNQHGGAWAVGTINAYSSGTSRTLVLRWDGVRWTVETSPNADAGGQSKTSLSAVGTLHNGYASAVGYMQDPSSSGYTPLAMTC